MIKVALVDAAGGVTSVVSPAHDAMYADGAAYGDHTAFHISPNANDIEVIKTWYRKDAEWRVRTPRPSANHDWNMTTETWEVDVKKAISHKNQEVERERERRNNLPIRYAGAKFDADGRAQRNVQAWQIQITAGVAIPPGFMWRDADNQEHPADAAFINGLGAAITMRGTQLYRASWAHKASIQALADSGDGTSLLAYDITTGWPMND